MITILRLYYEFLMTGLFAVGGGLATLPFLYKIAEKTGWYTTADIANMIAISESTPGPLGINMATYVGFKTVGLFGGIITTVGLVTTPIIIIIIVSKVLEKFKDSQTVKRIFYGLRPASTALIAVAGLRVAKLSLLHVDTFSKTGAIMDLFNFPNIVLAVLIYIGLVKFNKHPILYIAIAAAAGVVFQL